MRFLLTVLLGVAAAAAIAFVALGPGSGSGQGLDPGPSPEVVAADPDATARILVDGEPVAEVPATAVERDGRVLLIEQLSGKARERGAWKFLSARGRGGARFHVDDADQRFEGQQFHFYLSAGRLCLGAFRVFDDAVPEDVRREQDVPSVFVVNVEVVEIWTYVPERKEAAGPPPTLEIRVASLGAPRVLEPDDFDDLSEIVPKDLAEEYRATTGGTGSGNTSRSRQKSERRLRKEHNRVGWNLRDVLSLVVDVRDVVRVRAFGENDSELEVRNDQLWHGGFFALVWLNRRASFHFEIVGENPDGTSVQERIKGLTHLDVELISEEYREKPKPVTDTSVDVAGAIQGAMAGAEAARLKAMGELRRAQPDPEARQALVDLLEDPSATIRLAAVEALASFQDTAPLLLDVFETDDDDNVRLAAVHIVSNRGTTDMFPRLLEHVNFEDKIGKEAGKAIRKIAKRNGIDPPMGAIRPGKREREQQRRDAKGGG